MLVFNVNWTSIRADWMSTDNAYTTIIPYVFDNKLSYDENKLNYNRVESTPLVVVQQLISMFHQGYVGIGGLAEWVDERISKRLLTESLALVMNK